MTGSAVAAINRAVVIAETRGPEEGLAALDVVGAQNPVLDYQPYWAARARLLARCGDPAAADEAYALSIGLETDPAVREFLQKQRQALRH